MILAIDVGNTNIVLGTVENDSIRTIARLRTNPGETEAEFVIKLSELLSFYKIDPEEMEGSILSSVVPAVTKPLSDAVRQLTGDEPMIVGPGIKTGLDIRIDDPGTVAGDLIVGSVAAMNCYGAPSIIIDMGTATTVIAIDGNRAFRGGAILPGVNLSYRALSSGTSLLPSIAIVPPAKVIGTNTVDCMQSGAVYGTASMLDGLIERFENELGTKCTVVATGGIASSVIPYCKREIILDNDLLLKGLSILYHKNKNAKIR